MKLLTMAFPCFLVLAAVFVHGANDLPAKAKPDELARAVAAAREKGLDWLTQHQAADGSWGRTYTIAITSFVCLDYLSAANEPFTGNRGKGLVKALQFLLVNQKDGTFTQQGHTWIHGQGFGTLALSE